MDNPTNLPKGLELELCRLQNQVQCLISCNQVLTTYLLEVGLETKHLSAEQLENLAKSRFSLDGLKKAVQRAKEGQ